MEIKPSVDTTMNRIPSQNPTSEITALAMNTFASPKTTPASPGENSPAGAALFAKSGMDLMRVQRVRKKLASAKSSRKYKDIYDDAQADLVYPPPRGAAVRELSERLSVDGYCKDELRQLTGKIMESADQDFDHFGFVKSNAPLLEFFASDEGKQYRKELTSKPSDSKIDLIILAFLTRTHRLPNETSVDLSEQLLSKSLMDTNENAQEDRMSNVRRSLITLVDPPMKLSYLNMRTLPSRVDLEERDMELGQGTNGGLHHVAFMNIKAFLDTVYNNELAKGVAIFALLMVLYVVFQWVAEKFEF